jgi:hypothetical protein
LQEEIERLEREDAEINEQVRLMSEEAAEKLALRE